MNTLNPQTLNLGARAAAMTLSDAIEIITLAEEPELILERDDVPPAIDPRDLAAANLRIAWFEAERLNARASAAIH